MDTKELKNEIKNNIPQIQYHINEILNGKKLEEILLRINSSNTIPMWYEMLKNSNELPNLDGKTVGSVIEKILVCVIEKYIFDESVSLSINPARGVDIPELELGIKSPSTNFCTSEPYFSAYERLLGNEYDAVVLLTNYQEAKKERPFNLQINEIRYLEGSEIADKKLCECAKFLRENIDDECMLKKAIRFLAYINQSDWEAKWILKIINGVIIKEKSLDVFINKAQKDFENKNKKNQGKTLISDQSMERLLSIKTISPEIVGIINAADNWVIEAQKDNGRFPNDNEWSRFISSKLNGKIGMSFALQWRYNFSSIFK